MNIYFLGRLQRKSLKESEKRAIEIYTGTLLTSDTIMVAARMMSKHVIFHSQKHVTPTTVTNSCVCCFKTDIGDLQLAYILFFCHTTVPLAVVRVLKKTGNSVFKDLSEPQNQDLVGICSSVTNCFFHEVMKLSVESTLQAINVEKIISKCVHVPLKRQDTDYIITIPNPYEHH